MSSLVSLFSQKITTASNKPTFSRTKYKNCEYRHHKQEAQDVPAGGEGVAERDINVSESQLDYLGYL